MFRELARFESFVSGIVNTIMRTIKLGLVLWILVPALVVVLLFINIVILFLNR